MPHVCRHLLMEIPDAQYLLLRSKVLVLLPNMDPETSCHSLWTLSFSGGVDYFF